MIGERLGSWIIDRELGRGGMGCVYLAHRDDGDGPPQAAIKVLVAELAADPGFGQRFQREIAVLRQLDHPNIVRFLESGLHDGRSFYAMEYVEGPSFETLRERRGRLPWPEVLDLALQITPALKHAHDRGIIHRDIKPSNLMRAPRSASDPSEYGLVKLTDFGIASLFASPHLTVTGVVVGTAEYLSPEQAAGKPVTRRSDLYSLGVVLYTLLTGRTPFEGEVLDLLHKHRFAQFDRPARLVPELPADLDEIVCQLLEKDPSRRPPDGAILFRQLDSLRRKLERKATTPVHFRPGPLGMDGPAATERRSTEGPATLMSRLMRAELELQNRGGPVRRFLHQPLVLLTLFLLTTGVLAWTFWPLSAESLFQHGAALMASSDPDDWEKAWEKYLGPLERKYPDHPHRDEVEEFRQQLNGHRAGRQAERKALQAGPMSEAQWFYQEGLRLRQRGDEVGARRQWQALAEAFKDVPSEAPWVRLAKKELDQGPDPNAPARQWGPVREAVKQAREFRAQGRGDQAEAILRGLKELYRNDPAAQAILDGK
jgi:hypothetical protein